MSILGELTLLFLLICLCVSAYYIYKEKHINKTKMSFKESMDLAELPIVTFYQDDIKLNFLLDTGSNVSYINESILPAIKYTKTNESKSTIGVEGIPLQSEYCMIKISYKEKQFEDKFSILDLSSAFDTVKQDSGVQIHGILGSKFFEKYKYILDFKDLIAYIK
jgi:hypothetical protein